MSKGFTKSELKPDSALPVGTQKTHTRKQHTKINPQKKKGTYYSGNRKLPHGNFPPKIPPIVSSKENKRWTKVFKNLVSNCSTYFGYSEELAAPWPLQNMGGWWVGVGCVGSTDPLWQRHNQFWGVDSETEFWGRQTQVLLMEENLQQKCQQKEYPPYQPAKDRTGKKFWTLMYVSMEFSLYDVLVPSTPPKTITFQFGEIMLREPTKNSLIADALSVATYICHTSKMTCHEPQSPFNHNMLFCTVSVKTTITFPHQLHNMNYTLTESSDPNKTIPRCCDVWCAAPPLHDPPTTSPSFGSPQGIFPTDV